MVQQRLWGDDTDDMVDRWFQTHRSITGKGQGRTHNRHTWLRPLASLALQVALNSLQALAGTALLLVLSLVMLATVHTILRRVESR